MPRALLCVVAILCGLMLGCGNDLAVVAVEVTPTSPNIIGIGGTQQFQVSAKYNDGRSETVTLKSTYSIDVPDGPAPWAPSNALSINASGLLSAIDGACTWTKSGTEEDPIYGTSPYKLTVSYENFQAVAFVSVASLAGCEFPDPTKTNTIVVNTEKF